MQQQLYLYVKCVVAVVFVGKHLNYSNSRCKIYFVAVVVIDMIITVVASALQKCCPEIWDKSLLGIQKSVPNLRESIARYAMACPKSGAYHSEVGKVCPESGAYYSEVGKVCPKSRAYYCMVCNGLS